MKSSPFGFLPVVRGGEVEEASLGPVFKEAQEGASEEARGAFVMMA